jgi:rhodanese-related sulfurtransferase
MDADSAFAGRSSVRFLDVREPYEWLAGHVEGSVNVPIGAVARLADDLPRDLPTVVVCQVGQRSALVADFLVQRGFDAHNLEGGLEAWAARGLPLVTIATSGTVLDGWARDLSGRRLGSREEPEGDTI